MSRAPTRQHLAQVRRVFGLHRRPMTRGEIYQRARAAIVPSAVNQLRTGGLCTAWIAWTQTGAGLIGWPISPTTLARYYCRRHA